MTSATHTTFDLDTLRRALATWDVDELMTMYADDVEFSQIDATTGPSAPQLVRGRDALEAMFRRVAASGVATRVVDAIDGGDRIAVAVACKLPSGGNVYDHTFLTLRDGLIARQAAVAAWDG